MLMQVEMHKVNQQSLKVDIVNKVERFLNNDLHQNSGWIKVSCMRV